ncbi:MAG: glycine zipper 2TM domain-containing protein [Sneathiella sp.]|nr:glycine zipper 2TM domain-containing protein [Sneathiella sp.]
MKNFISVSTRLIASATIASIAMLSVSTSVAQAGGGHWSKKHGQKIVRVKEVERTVYYKVSKPKRRHSHKKHAAYHTHKKYVTYYERPVRKYRKKASKSHSISFDEVMGGRIIGALLGGVAGTQFGKGRGRTVAIVGGAIAGAVIGGEVGRSMRKSDQYQASQVLENVRTGQTVTWENPDTGRSFEMTPTKTYRTSSNRPCREYSTWVFVDGFEEQVTGRACRAPDGRWKMLS